MSNQEKELEGGLITATGDMGPHKWILKVDGKMEYSGMRNSGDALAFPLEDGSHELVFQIDSPNPFKGTANVAGKRLSFITDKETAYELRFVFTSPLLKKKIIWEFLP